MTPSTAPRCLRFEQDPKSKRYAVAVEDVRIDHSGDLSIEELMGVAVGYGQKESGQGPQVL